MLKDDNNYLKNEWLDELKNYSILNYNDTIIFEQQLKDYVGINYCSTTCNGTSALLLGMLALGLKEKDEIIIPSFSYHSIYNISQYLNLNIKICDIKKETLCMNPNELKNIISNNTKAVAFIDHQGYIGDDLFEVRNICNNYNIPLIEDSAQGLSQIYNNKMCGTIGDFGIYSFSGHKLLRSSEGGCLITNRQDVYEFVNKNKNLGIGNYIMSPLIGKLLQFQLSDIKNIISNRNKIYNLYKKYLNIIQFNYDIENYSTNAIGYLSPKANIIFNKFKLLNIETKYKKFKCYGNLPIGNNVFEEYIELPTTFTLSEKEIEKISKEIKNIENIKKDLTNIFKKINKYEK